MSACQRSFGISAWNRTNELRGRFCGWGVTKPRRDSTRQIVETAGARPWTPVKVEGDRVGAGVQTLFGQRLAQLDDLVLEPVGDPVRARTRPSGPRLKAHLTLGIEPADELVDPPSGDPVVPSHHRLGSPLDPDPVTTSRASDISHPSRPEVCTMSRDRWELCPETRHSRLRRSRLRRLSSQSPELGSGVGSSEQRPESIQNRWKTRFPARRRHSERCCSPPSWARSKAATSRPSRPS